MSISSSGLPTCSSPISDGNQDNVIPSADLVEHGEVVQISQLWTSVSNDNRKEWDLGLVNPQEMEKFHSVQPRMPTNARRNPWMFNPLKSKVNIASIGVREIQKHIASTGFSKTVDVQMEALNQAKESNPKGRWWIKADGCDVRRGLRESMRGIWAGDEDLGDGSLQALFEGYKVRCMFVKSIGLTGRSRVVSEDVQKLLLELESDLEFLTVGAPVANDVYSKALQGGKATEQKMMELAWSAVGFEELVKKVRGFQSELNDFVQEGGEGASA